MELLLEYTYIYGYGNWDKISTEFNEAISNGNVGEKKYFIKKTAGGKIFLIFNSCELFYLNLFFVMIMKINIKSVLL